MFKSILVALVCAATVFISGCGGGGGGGGSSPEPVSISVSQQSIAVATTTYGTAPSTGVTVSVDHVPSSGLYIQGSYTVHGIDSVSSSIMGSSEFLYITFRAPATLGVGVYTDTITIQVCRDQQCTQQVTNSPQQIAVTYTVTTGTLPTLAALSPPTAARGGSDFFMTLTGTNFDFGSQVYWNGAVKRSTFVSATQLSVQIPASDIAAVGSYPVTVMNSLHPGAQSNSLSVSVANAALSLTKLSPTSVTVGNPAFTQTVVGTGFDSSSVVQWNGSARPTTYVSTTELLAQINAADVASLTTANVTVTGPSSSVSNAMTVTIAAPSIHATNLQTNSQRNNVINFANIVAPSAFPLSSKWTATLSGSTVNVLTANGSVFAMASTSVGGNELSALSMATGARLWGPISFDGPATAAYDNGRVFVFYMGNANASILAAYDAASGTQLWSTTLPPNLSFSAGVPTAAHGMIYVAGDTYSGPAVLFAVDQMNGLFAWSKPVDSGYFGVPTVTADGVYLSYYCKTSAYRPLTGESIWSNDSGCGAGPGRAAVAANGLLYARNLVSGIQGTVFDARTGALNSTYTDSESLPVIGSQIGYFLLNGRMRAIRLSDGASLWSDPGTGYLESAPLLVNNYLFAYSYTGYLVAWDATTGTQLWASGNSGTLSTSSPAIAGGSKVYAGGGLLFISRGNNLIAYTLSNNP